MARKISRARWFFDRALWTPTFDDLSLALSSIQLPEKDRVLRYVFVKDAVGTLSGRLMIRKFITDVTGLPWDGFEVSRNHLEKPIYAPNPAVQFNVSHQGRYTVLAGETEGADVGVDVMEMKYTGGKPIQEFFRLMYRQLTDREWEAVKQSSLESQQIKTFYRIWCLKESYVKATGAGLSLSLQSLDFRFKSKLRGIGQIITDTEVFLDGQKQEDWQFQEALLDENYCACVAVRSPGGHLDRFSPLTFSPLSFKDLIESCRPIIPRDEPGCKEMLRKFSEQLPDSKK